MRGRLRIFREGTSMNRMILLLNLAVLVANFILAFSATSSQIGILRTASDVSLGRGASRYGRAGLDGSPTAYLRIVQSFERIAPPQTKANLTSDQLEGIQDAIFRYRQVVAAGVERALYEGEDPQEILRAHARLGEDARREVEQILSLSFPNSAFVSRLTTEIIKNCP